MMKEQEQKIIDMLLHYYEVDLDNCNMTHTDWIKELARAIVDPKYLSLLRAEYKLYLKERS